MAPLLQATFAGALHFTDLAGDDGPDADPLTHVPEWAVGATMAMNNDRLLLVHPMAVEDNLQVYKLD